MEQTETENSVNREQATQSEANLAEAQRLSHTVSGLNPATNKISIGLRSVTDLGLIRCRAPVPRKRVQRSIRRPRQDVEETQEALQEERLPIEFRIVLPDGTAKYLKQLAIMYSPRVESLSRRSAQTSMSRSVNAPRSIAGERNEDPRPVDANIIGSSSGHDGRFEANEALLHILGYHHEDLVAGRIRWTDLRRRSGAIATCDDTRTQADRVSSAV